MHISLYCCWCCWGSGTSALWSWRTRSWVSESGRWHRTPTRVDRQSEVIHAAAWERLLLGSRVDQQRYTCVLLWRETARGFQTWTGRRGGWDGARTGCIATGQWRGRGSVGALGRGETQPRHTWTPDFASNSLYFSSFHPMEFSVWWCSSGVIRRVSRYFSKKV